MVDQLSLYNGALRVLKERKLASLTENREPRRLMDDVWTDQFVRHCLEQASWIFATRSRQVDYSPSVEPSFGLRYAFDKPSDWIRTVAITSDPYFRTPLTNLLDEGGFWFSDLQTIYVRYVSDDSAFGTDFSHWPPSFVRYAEHAMAWQISPRILKTDNDVREVERRMNRALTEAKGKDALNDGPAVLPEGGWARARRGSTGASLWNGQWR